MIMLQHTDTDLLLDVAEMFLLKYKGRNGFRVWRRQLSCEHTRQGSLCKLELRWKWLLQLPTAVTKHCNRHQNTPFCCCPVLSALLQHVRPLT